MWQTDYVYCEFPASLTGELSYIIPRIISLIVSSNVPGSSVRSWQLDHDLTVCTSGLVNIDSDLNFVMINWWEKSSLCESFLKLYGQLPERISSAAGAVMVKKIRKVVTDVSVAFLNIGGFLMTWGVLYAGASLVVNVSGAIYNVTQGFKKVILNWDASCKKSSKSAIVDCTKVSFIHHQIMCLNLI